MALRPMQKLAEPAFAKELFVAPPSAQSPASAKPAPALVAEVPHDYRPPYAEPSTDLRLPVVVPDGALADEADLAAVRALEGLGVRADAVEAADGAASAEAGAGWQAFATGDSSPFRSQPAAWAHVLGSPARETAPPAAPAARPATATPHVQPTPAAPAGPAPAAVVRGEDLFKARSAGGPLWESVEVSAEDAGANPRLESLVRQPQPQTSGFDLADEIDLG